MSGEVPRRRFRKTKIALAIFVLLLLALLVPPYISLNTLRRQMTASISRSLGRQVQIQSMHLRLLPTPGIVLEGFTVDSDPAFGSEPALIAPSVVATLRVSSLWRRPIEVSSISMDRPSVNLVRNAQGRWNFSSIILQAARTPLAPTTQPHPGSTPRFPYISIDHGRINFKDGLVKLPFSLFNADVAIWQQSASRWRIRLHAQPVRTDLDLDLGDTGSLRMDGSIGRTTDLDTLPVHLSLSWHDEQLGQASRLLSGRDLGWRGQLNMDGSLRGTLRNLDLQWKIHIDNPHRIEFTPPSSPDLNATCQATYRNSGHAVDNILCLLPTPPGHLLLTGSIPNLNHPKPSLRLEVNHLPASFITQLLGLVRKNAGSVDAQGLMNGAFTYGPQPPPAASKSAAHRPSTARPGRPGQLKGWQGQAEFSPLTLHLNGLDHPIVVPHLTVYAGTPPAPRRHPRQARSLHRHAFPWPAPIHHTRLMRKATPSEPSSGLPPFRLNIAPSSFSFGSPAPITVSGQIDNDGFQLRMDGSASIAALSALHQQLGAVPLPLGHFSAHGMAQLNLALSGPWIAPFRVFATEPSVVPSGTMQLTHVVFQPGFLSGPANISSADITFTPLEVTWNGAAFTIGSLKGHFSTSYPTFCQATVCPARFTLNLPRADAAQLMAAFTGSDAHGVLWADLLAHLNQGHRYWPAATGAVRIDGLTAGPLLIHHVLANISVSGTSLTIASLDADSLLGHLHAQGSIFAGGDSPAWHLSLAGSHIAVPRLAALFHQHWGAGRADIQTQFTMNGWSLNDLATSANGTFTWTWNHGSLGTAPPLDRFTRWTAHGTIANSRLTLTSSTLWPSGHHAPIPVSGSISFGHALYLTLGSSKPGDTNPVATVSGILSQPVVHHVKAK